MSSNSDVVSTVKSIKKREVLPIYFIQGEESFFVDELVDALEEFAIPEEDKAFSQTVLYAKDVGLAEVLSLARQFPMMGEKQLILVKEAQEWKWDTEDHKKIAEYAEQPVPTTILVISVKGLAIKDTASSKAVKAIKALPGYHHFPKLRDYQLPKWIESIGQQQGLILHLGVSVLLAEYLGADLSRVKNELDKLKIALKDRKEVSQKDIEDNIGISNEYNVFELQKALGTGNGVRAMKIALILGKNAKDHPINRILANLMNYFTNILLIHSLKNEADATLARKMRVHAFFVKEYRTAASYYPMKMISKTISEIRKADLQSKGVDSAPMPNGEILKELVYKIINIQKI